MVHTLDRWAIMLPEGVLTIEIETNRPAVSTLKGVGLNLAALQSEALHNLQDGVIVELQAREQRTLQVIGEQKVNNAQMTVQRDSTINLVKAIIDKNERTTKVVTKACKSVPELDILNDEPVDVTIRKLVTRVRDARIELAKVPFDLNLNIAKLQLLATWGLT